MTKYATEPDPLRHDWAEDEVLSLMSEPFNDLLYVAQTVHRQHFDPNRVQVSTLLSIKTGGCPEDCGYCSQSLHHQTGIQPEKLMSKQAVRAAALRARDDGATRFCMGAAWRGPRERDLETVCEMIREVRSLGMETCATLGSLEQGQAEQLKNAGLDYYNHNIDTSERHYPDIVSTHSFRDRLETLERVRHAGINVCCGGILGMGETRADRAAMLTTLASLEPHPESVPLNLLVPVAGTPLGDRPPLDLLEFVRTIATARIVMPRSVVRLSAGRLEMDSAAQALCFLAGANSLFYGDRLLTTPNPDSSEDHSLFERLGIKPGTVGLRASG